jgi:5-methylcytosine-specific restriction endonuclease McrA
MDAEIREKRRAAQRAAHDANRARVVERTCRGCGRQFTTTADRRQAQWCDIGACVEAKAAHDKAVKREAASLRTREERQAERRRIAEQRGKTYLTAEERAERKAARLREAEEQRRTTKRSRFTKDERRERARVRAALKYATQPEEERARCASYKRENPAKRRNWDHRRRVRMNAGFIEPVNIERIVMETECVYCGSEISPSTLHIDHVVPIALGGEHSERNLVASCRRCNTAKGSKPLAAWLSTLAPERRVAIEKLCESRRLHEHRQPRDGMVIAASLHRKRAPKSVWSCGCCPSTGTRCQHHAPRTDTGGWGGLGSPVASPMRVSTARIPASSSPDVGSAV